MMTKRLIMAACLLFALAACKKDPEPTPPVDITGEWQLASIATKAASLGGQSVDVYVSFTSDGKFELYQQLGQGWYTYYSGSWKLSEGILSGSYADGKAWGSQYNATVEGDKMTLVTAGGGETDTYTRTTIPESVKNHTHRP